MLPRNHPDRIQIAFDDHRLVANAGLLLPVTLAQHLGLREVVDSHVDLGDAPGRANPGDKLLTLVASALAGGDFIDDADVLRTGGTGGAIGCVVKGPSTLGTFLRSFRWGHVRQLDRVSRELLSRAWAAGAGPGEGPLTIDLDSTMCETYGLDKEGARHHGYTGQRGYHPLLAIAAGTGDVLMSRLREGRANTVRGAAHFLRETVGRVRHAGATGQLTVRADSGFYAHALVVVCREMDVRFSITIRQHARLRELIEAISEEDWTPVPYWMDRGADVAETTYTPFQGEPEAAPVRLIVRRVKPTPGSQLALFTSYSYHGFITDRDGEALELEADHRRHAEIEGEFTHPGPWTIEGAAGVGHLLRELHESTASYQPPPDAVWPPWFGRRLGGPNRTIGHCDVAAWNIVARDGLPVALIDWETAGPVDPMIELAQACWLNAKLFSDDVAEREGLPSLEVRARQLRAIVDAYGLSTAQRRRIVDLIIGYAIHDAAEQDDEFGVTHKMVDPMPDGYPIIWGLTWRIRAAAWVYRNRDTLETTIT